TGDVLQFSRGISPPRTSSLGLAALVHPAEMVDMASGGDMDSTSDRARPPYRQIADAIRDRIAVGELLPGDAVPSTRQLTAEYGVAMATATKVLAALRQDGLIETRPGVGARVTSRPAPQRPATPRGTEQLSRERIV